MRKIKRLFYVSIVFTSILTACLETDLTPDAQMQLKAKGGKGKPSQTDTTFSVNRENQYALNVVFFKPTDFTATQKVLDNVSDMMLFIQNWYEKQMELQGYGARTFGLMTANGKVNVILIEAPEASTFYDTDAKIMDVINQHYEAYPDDNQSAHTLVLGHSGSGVGFHGRGRWAFATSPDNFNLTGTGKYIGDLELLKAEKLGGIMHELGHAINLNHNCEKSSDLPDKALMGNGNRTYVNGNEELVFLTKADCAILNTSQTFSTKDKIYYEDELNPIIKSYSVSKDDAKQVTVIQGLVSSTLKLTDFIVGHDGLPSGGISGYDKITWCDHLMPTEKPDEYSFYAEMPYSDIFNNYGPKDSLELTLEVVAENGLFSKVANYVYTMNETTKVPNDDIIRNYFAHTFSDRSEWSVNANSVAPYSSTVVEHMIDGDKSTNWMCKWPYSIAQSGSHIITVNMGGNKLINGIYWFSDKSGNQFRPKHVIIETSDDGANWSIAKEVTIASKLEAKEAFVSFDNPVNASYFRLTVDQVYSDNTTDNLVISELDIF